MNTTSPDRIAKHDLIDGLIKGLEVLKAFQGLHDCVTVTDVAQRAQLSRAAARRYLLTLTHIGMAVHQGRYFRLTYTGASLAAGLDVPSGMPEPVLLEPPRSIAANTVDGMENRRSDNGIDATSVC